MKLLDDIIESHGWMVGIRNIGKSVISGLLYAVRTLEIVAKFPGHVGGLLENPCARLRLGIYPLF